jgi:hypothetical protein
MDQYETLLVEYLKEGKITMDNYVHLNNTNLLNIKDNLLLVNKFDNSIKDGFNKRYSEMIKLKDNEIVFKNKIIFNRLIKKSNLTYTEDQKNSIDNMIRFISNSNDKLFGLFGYAGTGKTTTIIDFLMNCLELKYINSLVFTAPTNKALNVIKTKVSDKIKYLLDLNNISYEDKLSFDMNCDKLKKKNIIIEFQTIHKLLKYKTEYNTDGEIIFTKDKDNIIDGYDIIVIDECSMIPLGLTYEILKESAKIKTKIIFTGDPAQLPPVNEKISSVFMTQLNKITLNKMQSLMPTITVEEYDNFCNTLIRMDQYVLKDIVRTKHNSIIKCSNTVRDWVYNLDDFINISEHTNLNMNIYSFDKSVKTKTNWYKEFEKLIKIEKDTIIIAWTNDEVKYYNNFIRKSLYTDKEHIREYEMGDILILNEFYILANTTSNKSDNQFNKVKFNTSEKIIVKNIQEINYDFEKLTHKVNGNIKTFQNHRSIETKYKKFVDQINSINIHFKCYKMKVVKIDELDSEYEIIVLKHDEHMIHKNLIINTIEEIKKFRNELFAQYKLMSIDSILVQPLYNDFYSKFINPFASVSYGYAITCHKAQGSNYKNVFVDFSDIVKNRNENEMKRCTYTAVSRTIDNLYILV